MYLRKEKEGLLQYFQNYGLEYKIFKRKISDLEVIINDKYVSTKIKSDKNEIRTDFHDKALPLERTTYATYSITHIDSVYKKKR